MHVMVEAAGTRPVPKLRQARAGLYAIYAAEGLVFASVISRIPQVQRAHRLSDTTINLLVALVPVMAIVGGLVAARLSARFGSGIVLRFAQVPMYLAIILMGAAGGTAQLFATVVLVGLTIGVLEASMNAHAIAVQRVAGRSLVNGFFAVWSGASILGSLWVALANKNDVSVLVGFLLPASVGIVVAMFTGRSLLPKELEGVGPGAAQIKAAARLVPWRPILIIGGALGLVYMSEAAITGFSVKYVGSELHASDVLAPLAVTAFACTTVVGRSLADLAVRRWGTARIVRTGAFIAVIGLVCVSLATHPAVAIGGFAVAGLGLCSMAPSAYTAAASHDPTGLGIAVARTSIFNYLGFVMGGVLVAAVQPIASYRACYAIGAVVIVMVLLLSGRFRIQQPSMITNHQ